MLIMHRSLHCLLMYRNILVHSILLVLHCYLCRRLALVKSRMRTAVSEPGLICSLFPGASAYATGMGPGKENRGQSRKQKKSKEDENKSSCSLMAEGMVASLQNLNTHLEEQQRQKQRASKNGASGDVSDEKSEDSVKRDTSSVVSSDCASSRKLSKNGYK